VKIKKTLVARHQWLMTTVPAIQEAEIKRIMVRSRYGQIVHKTLSHPNSPPPIKNPSQ
jgi:hypothetical protein